MAYGTSERAESYYLPPMVVRTLSAPERCGHNLIGECTVRSDTNCPKMPRSAFYLV